MYKSNKKLNVNQVPPTQHRLILVLSSVQVQFDELYAQALAEEERIAGSSHTQSQQNRHGQVYEQTDGGMPPDVLTDDYEVRVLNCIP